MCFLSYANETMYLLWDLTFFKSVLPETNFCLKPWADNGSTNQYSCQLFYGWGWHTLCHSISKILIVGEGPGEIPSALRHLSTWDEVCPNPCPLSRWCHPTITSSVVPSCPQSIFPSIRDFSNESALRIRWPKYWSFTFSISPSNGYSGLISFRMDWLDLLAVQGTLKSLSLRTMYLVAMGIRHFWPNWPPRLTNMRFHTKISHCQKDCNTPLYSQSPL